MLAEVAGVSDTTVQRIWKPFRRGCWPSGVRSGVGPKGNYYSDFQLVPSLIHSIMEKKAPPTLGARFFKTGAGSEPVRDWLKDLPVVERKTIGADIKTVQFGWPLGMPLVAHLESGIWEVRTRLSNRIARVLFVLDGDVMVLLHGFIKKEQKTPKPELDLAKERLKLLKRQK